MSAYIVEDSTINRIISACSLPELEIPFARSFGSLIDNPYRQTVPDLFRLGRDLFALNITGVEARYGEGRAAEFRPLNYSPSIHPLETIPAEGWGREESGLSAVFKSAGELSYQCAEGDADAIPLYMALIAFRDALKPIAKREADELAAAKCREAEAMRKRNRESGSAWLAENRPAWAKSAIVAELVSDQSDSQSDYHGSTTKRTVLLAWSKHTRDLFPEMRKAAANFEPTASLATAPESAEHREKWSMGGGFYLKDSYRHRSGWKVSKTYLDDWSLVAACADPANIALARQAVTA